MPAPELAITLLQRFEGLRLLSYVDPAGVATIGYGHTGADVSVGMQITRETAEALLREDADRAARCVDDHVDVVLLPSQRAALVSLVYNIGCDAFAKSTLLKRLNEGHARAAAQEFVRWVHAGGQVLPGLVTRRARGPR